MEEELQELIESQESTGAIEYTDMPKGGGNQSDLSNYMVEREKIWKKIHKARYRRIMIFQEIKNVIERLPSADEREVISYRYIRLMTWEQICVKIKKEWAQVHRYHAKSLLNIEKMYIKNKNDIE